MSFVERGRRYVLPGDRLLSFLEAAQAVNQACRETDGGRAYAQRREGRCVGGLVGLGIDGYISSGVVALACAVISRVLDAEPSDIAVFAEWAAPSRERRVLLESTLYLCPTLAALDALRVLLTTEEDHDHREA